ncbi:MAG: flippase-like domain-containing protein [Chlamydiales bacterium]|nr:flippase-like domain-containing protein [Chlamydiia bacterium]MCP5508054.1 flippase-like domain-containing protein [Chlamydiales bacterium]
MTTNNHPQHDLEHPHLLSGWRFAALVTTIVLSVIGYFLFTLWGGWRDVFNAIGEIGYAGIALGLGIALISYFFRFTRWNYFLSVLGQRVPYFSSMRIYISGFTLTTTPGKAGEALRSIFLKDYDIPYRTSFGALLAERFSDLIAVAVLAAGGLFIYERARLVLLFVGLFIIFLLYAVQKDSWLQAIERWTKSKLHSRFAHVVEFMVETVIAFRSCFTPRVLLVGIFLGCIAWGLEGVILYYYLKILGNELSIYLAIFIHAFALLIGALTLLPGGLGGAEVTMFQLLLFYGVPAGDAVTATIVVRLSTLWFSVLIGLIALPKKQVKLR